MRKELEYLTHSEILGKIEVMQKNAKQLSSKFGVDHLLPHMDHIVAQVHREDEQQHHQQQQQQVRFVNKSKSSKKKHDSWSSRASSILNNPESIYVSREEVLKNLQNDNSGMIRNSRHSHIMSGNPDRNSGRELERGKQRRQQQQQQQHRQQHQHGSWSSRASSILASAHQKEPNYMSRAEIIENLADAAYDALSRHSSSMDSDSDASTVKSVILNKKRQQQQQQPRDQADDSKFPPNPYMGESDTCSCTSCELYYLGDGYCSTCDGEYSVYGDEDIYDNRGGNGNLTYTKDPNESTRKSKNPAQNSTKLENRRGPSSNAASTDGGEKSKALSAAPMAMAGRDKGKRNGSVSSNEGSDGSSKVNMNRDRGGGGGGGENGRTNRERISGKPSSAEMKNSSSESVVGKKKRISVSSSSGGGGSDSKKVSTKTTSAASSFSSRLGGSRRRSQEIVVPVELGRDDSKFPPKPNYGAMADVDGGAAGGGAGGGDLEDQIYRAVGVGEIQRQKNERVLRRHLRDLASDWNSRIDDLNTLRRTRVIKELKRFLRGNIDLDRSRPEEIGRQGGYSVLL